MLLQKPTYNESLPDTDVRQQLHPSAAKCFEVKFFTALAKTIFPMSHN